jgi:sec-independent protein translocase protein TatB
MFDIGVLELGVIAVVGLLVFGPDRLPAVAREAGAWLRQIRQVLARARQEVTDTIGVDLATSPRRLVQDTLLGEDAESPARAKPPLRGDAPTDQSSGGSSGAPQDRSGSPSRSTDPDWLDDVS